MINKDVAAAETIYIIQGIQNQEDEDFDSFVSEVRRAQNSDKFKHLFKNNKIMEKEK